MLSRQNNYTIKNKRSVLPWSQASLPTNAGVSGLIPGMGRSPGEGNGNPFQYSCLEYSLERGARQAPVHGAPKKSDTAE